MSPRLVTGGASTDRAATKRQHAGSVPFRVERDSIVCDACALDAATSRSMTAWRLMPPAFSAASSLHHPVIPRVSRGIQPVCAHALDAATSRSMTARGSMDIEHRVFINVLNQQPGSFFMPECQHISCDCLRQGAHQEKHRARAANAGGSWPLTLAGLGAQRPALKLVNTRV